MEAPPGFYRIINSMVDVEETYEELNYHYPDVLYKSNYRKIAAGFRVLLLSLERRELEVCNTLVKWLNLYVNISKLLDDQPKKSRKQFEKTLPLALSYMFACLKYLPVTKPHYRFQLVKFTEQLLAKVRPTTIEKIVSHEKSCISNLWETIDNSGDYNTQMVTLRLVLKLLRHFDNMRRKNELEKVLGSRTATFLFKLQISSAFEMVSSNEEGCKNIIRDFLNSYNCSKCPNELVFSFRCECFTLGDEHTFYKSLSNEEFWIDLNYGPQTLTFSGRYKARNDITFTKVYIRLNIRTLKLEYKTLTFFFEPPAQFSRELSNYDELQSITYAKINLPDNEALRLKVTSLFPPTFDCIDNDTEDDIQWQFSLNTLQTHLETDPKSLEISPQNSRVDQAVETSLSKNSSVSLSGAQADMSYTSRKTWFSKRNPKKVFQMLAEKIKQNSKAKLEVHLATCNSKSPDDINLPIQKFEGVSHPNTEIRHINLNKNSTEDVQPYDIPHPKNSASCYCSITNHEYDSQAFTPRTMDTVDAVFKEVHELDIYKTNSRGTPSVSAHFKEDIESRNSYVSRRTIPRRTITSRIGHVNLEENCIDEEIPCNSEKSLGDVQSLKFQTFSKYSGNEYLKRVLCSEGGNTDDAKSRCSKTTLDKHEILNKLEQATHKLNGVIDSLQELKSELWDTMTQLNCIIKKDD